ncbi:hypothetical protein [Demetria terragena]|uniref:hypothetical protein n=1 Tax=Demetria terragena TaxID=63959 RepID=UPI000374B723|nr:hypothetical protein [Demetria terragena]
MTPAVLELDVETIPATDSTLTEFASPEEARRADEKQALTPGTVNTYAVGIGACIPCC